MRDLRPILLVEDDSVDVMIFKRALRDLDIPNPVIHAEGGEAGLRLLQQDQEPDPYLIVTDLNMPRMNGLEFLREVKHNPQLRRIPVVILTTSDNEQDINKSFHAGASGYLLKNSNYTEFTHLIETVLQYWSSSQRPSTAYHAVDMT